MSLACSEQVSILQARHEGMLTYGICKNLTEQMIASYHMRPFPVCINRPVGIGPVAKLPCPGYVGNTAGPTGMLLSVSCGTSVTYFNVTLQSCLCPAFLGVPELSQKPLQVQVFYKSQDSC